MIFGSVDWSRMQVKYLVRASIRPINFLPLGNTNIPNENGHWSFGTKASHYINASRPPWSNHYQMFSYINEELPKIIDENFPTLPGERGIMGFR